MPRADLQSCHVVVTRPRGQSSQLIQWISDRGGEVLDFPVLMISPVDDAQTDHRPLSEYDIIIFVSANAVGYFPGTGGPWPTGVRIAAVGAATARSLEQAGLQPDLVPAVDFTSEGLLALPELASPAISGRRILIVRGEGGRETLGLTLTARGAQVDYREVYRRGLPPTDPAPLLDWLRGSRADFIVVTSGEGLQNLFLLVGDDDREALCQCRFILFSERLAILARDMGVKPKPIVCRIASDKGIIDAISENYAPDGDGP